RVPAHAEQPELSVLRGAVPERVSADPQDAAAAEAAGGAVGGRGAAAVAAERGRITQRCARGAAADQPAGAVTLKNRAQLPQAKASRSVSLQPRRARASARRSKSRGALMPAGRSWPVMPPSRSEPSPTPRRWP